jgi:hypothetical protein
MLSAKPIHLTLHSLKAMLSHGHQPTLKPPFASARSWPKPEVAPFDRTNLRTVPDLMSMKRPNWRSARSELGDQVRPEYAHSGLLVL